MWWEERGYSMTWEKKEKKEEEKRRNEGGV